jgi:hypothetical protein
MHKQEVIRGFQEQGYGYADYPNESGWGILTVSHQRMVELAKSVGTWYETLFLEHGWDNHQAVYAFAMQLPKRRFRADAVKHGAHVALLRKVQS